MHPYFDVVVGLVRSNDPESSAGGSVATGRVSHAKQFKGDDPDKKGCLGPPSWGTVTGRNSLEIVLPQRVAPLPLRATCPPSPGGSTC
jgi:hypothetical protein